MKILHRYILSQLLRNFLLTAGVFTLLFMVVDFFDRVDNVFGRGADLLTIFSYFAYKIPFTINVTLPVAMLVATLLTIGVLSRKSEITAMRAAGVSIFWVSRPVFALGIIISVVSLFLTEMVTPFTQRRVKEIYDIDIKGGRSKEGYNRTNFWFRNKRDFFSVDMFDSRRNALIGVSVFELDKNFKVRRRTDAREATWINAALGWSMKDVEELKFEEGQTLERLTHKAFPLPMNETPRSFYNTGVDAFTMSYRELRKFINRQDQNGIPIASYLPDLYAKFSFAFINFIIPLVVLPFAIRTARSGNLAGSAVAAAIAAFSYYAVHSFSIALGRAELWPPLLSAWMANLVLGLCGVILFLGVESPE